MPLLSPKSLKWLQSPLFFGGGKPDPDCAAATPAVPMMAAVETPAKPNASLRASDSLLRVGDWVLNISPPSLNYHTMVAWLVTFLQVNRKRLFHNFQDLSPKNPVK